MSAITVELDPQCTGLVHIYMYPHHPAAETDEQKMEDGSTSGQNIYRPLIYSFAAVGGVLLTATLVLVGAILIVQYKRRQLLNAHILTQEQKIAIMKQTGYVNPTYKFFDKHNDS